MYVLARVGSSCESSESMVPLGVGVPGAGGGSFDIGEYRKKILSQSTPHIIECAEAEEGGSQDVCHLSRKKRYGAINQKGMLFFCWYHS